MSPRKPPFSRRTIPKFRDSQFEPITDTQAGRRMLKTSQVQRKVGPLRTFSSPAMRLLSPPIRTINCGTTDQSA